MGYAIKCNRVVEVEKVEETTNILAYFLGALALIFFVTSGYLLVDNKNLKQSLNQLRSSSKKSSKKYYDKTKEEKEKGRGGDLSVNRLGGEDLDL